MRSHANRKADRKANHKASNGASQPAEGAKAAVVSTEQAQRSDWISRIRKLPELLNNAVSGLNDEQLNTPYGEGKWTILQLVHHLADSHMNGFVRMKLVLTENKPTLKTYEQDAWARTREAEYYPLLSSLHIINGLHERWCSLLESLPQSAWERKAIHAEWGEVTLEQLLQNYAEHGELHLRRILELREARGW